MKARQPQGRERNSLVNGLHYMNITLPDNWFLIGLRGLVHWALTPIWVQTWNLFKPLGCTYPLLVSSLKMQLAKWGYCFGNWGEVTWTDCPGSTIRLLSHFRVSSSVTRISMETIYFQSQFGRDWLWHHLPERVGEVGWKVEHNANPGEMDLVLSRESLILWWHTAWLRKRNWGNEAKEEGPVCLGCSWPSLSASLGRVVVFWGVVWSKQPSMWAEGWWSKVVESWNEHRKWQTEIGSVEGLLALNIFACWRELIFQYFEPVLTKWAVIFDAKQWPLQWILEVELFIIKVKFTKFDHALTQTSHETLIELHFQVIVFVINYFLNYYQLRRRSLLWDSKIKSPFNGKKHLFCMFTC